MNTEKFCVIEVGYNKYHNKIFNFTGSMHECRDFASLKRFGGGVEILKSKKMDKRSMFKVTLLVDDQQCSIDDMYTDDYCNLKNVIESDMEIGGLYVSTIEHIGDFEDGSVEGERSYQDQILLDNKLINKEK